MSESPNDPTIHPAFLVAVFVIAIVVGVLVAYLGITGKIGAGIP